MVLPLRHTDALYIGGEWVAVSGREEIVNPADETIIGLAPVGGQAELNAALAAARDAFDRGPWPRTPPAQRAGMLQRLYDVIERRSGEIKELIIAEAGATRAGVSGMQFDVPMQHARYFIEQARRLAPKSLPVEVSQNPNGGKLLGAATIIYEPIGVVAAITAFNVPFLLNISKIFPALAAGNTVVLKPSPFTPYEALILGEIADEACLPAGALNIITGGADVAAALTSDPRVDLISFTGSDAVGSLIQAQAAPTLKKCLFELGGKSALLILEDADLQRAAINAAANITHQAGQSCAATTRWLVHNSVRERFVDLVSNAFTSTKIGNPSQADVRMGPLIRETQRRRSEIFVELGRDSGARLVCGGKRPADLRRGYFFEPTLFDAVDNRSRLAQEEIFGPIAVIVGFDTDDEAIALANDSAYGLSGGVYSANLGRAYELALQIRTGRVNLNGGFGKISSHIPFGGIKRSGYGREYGEQALYEYMYEKAIAFHAG